MPVTFRGARGEALEASLERPVGSPVACALFVHCLDCGPDARAADPLARALTRQGLAVLRFDLARPRGEEGDTATPSVDDVVAAVDWLREHFHGPRVLLGDSLGGLALASVLPRLPEAEALATLNAPAGGERLLKLLGPEAMERGEGTLRLGARRVRLTRGFLEDVSEARVAEALGGFDGALLVLHATRDVFVPLEEARKLAGAARRPASLVTLEGADHFLSREEDARFAAEVLGAWATRYGAGPVAAPPLPQGVVEVREVGTGRFAQEVLTGVHRLRVDEPGELGGDDTGPTPYALLAAALGACSAMTLRVYARRHGLPLERVLVRLRHDKVHAQDCIDCETEEGKVDLISREVVLEGPLSAEERARLLEMADRCPVHRTLEQGLRVRTWEGQRAWWEAEGADEEGAEATEGSIPAGG